MSYKKWSSDYLVDLKIIKDKTIKNSVFSNNTSFNFSQINNSQKVRRKN